MTDTTSLQNLPTTGTDVSVMNTVHSNDNQVVQTTLDPTMMNELVSNIQTAHTSGSLDLPCRDIPMETKSITHDETTTPNYVPRSETYIEKMESANTILENQVAKETREKNMDMYYDEFHGYILVAILYFFFQLPLFNKLIIKYFPFCFFGDGNLNVTGYVSKSLLFAICYYVIMKILSIMNHL
jgi:hypothetical protein